MQQVFQYIKEFYQKEFRLFYFILILFMLGVLVYFNYWHQLEKQYVAGGHSNVKHFAGYYLLYFVPFSTAFFLQKLFYKNCIYFKKYWFWIILIIAPAIFSFRVNFDYHEVFVAKIWQGEAFQFWARCINWVVRVLIILILIFIVWAIKDKNNQLFYGTKKLDNVKPYLWMLVIMIPLIALASTQKDFLHMYPKVKFLNEMDIGKDKWRYLVYEICYGFDFVSIEFFFRGFLIFSLIKICGTHCIIPVACFYCMIHFGKPMAEAISSFFGGMLLAIISYRTKSVWGGLLVHLGIAWLMEIGGWLGHLY
ncbi:MAG: CPBP family intramembrane metalloprotease [Chitinophagaceae bacterium]|nr:CPBP family intramembrane metalloprotease [Chitinophagaceae bacterium]